MTVMGREDGWLSGGRERVESILKIASEPVICVRKHEMTIAQLPASGACPVCKKAGVNSEVTLKSEAVETDASNRRELAKAGYFADDDAPEDFEESKGGYRRMVKSEDMVETGGTINFGRGDEKITTRKSGNPRRGLFTGTR